MGPARVWPWRLLLGVIFLAAAASLWVAAERVDYTWRWNRVPQYFAFRAETVHRAAFAGTVTDVSVQGQTARVSLRGDQGESDTLEVAAQAVRVGSGDLVSEGDPIGSTFRWRAGPLAWGLWTTIWISFVSGALGLVLGLATGLCRIARNPTLRGLASFYVELIRGTPLLVQIFIFYFFIGTLFDLDRIVAGVGALAIFAGAYVAEIIRAGIQSIPRGQMEAARSLGMNVRQAMIHIILPQALKRTLPPLAGQFISLIKDSSLVSVIAITDLTKSGREVITSSFATFEIWFTVAALYLVVTSMLSQAIAWMERRLAVSD